VRVELPFGTAAGSVRWNLPRSGTIDVQLRRVRFGRWRGSPPASTWNGKRQVGSPERPFAELAIAHKLAQAGWVSAWVYRPGLYLSSWEPKVSVAFPAEALSILAEIGRACAVKGGCWDVFGWRAGVPIFAELKWPGDHIRPSQRKWLDAAVQTGVLPDQFVIVQCAWRSSRAE